MSNAQNMNDAFDYTEDLRGKLMAAIGDINQAQADFKPSEDLWSLGEVIHHLTLSETGSFARLKSLFDGSLEQPTLLGKDGDDNFLAAVADIAKTGKAPAPKDIVPTSGKNIQELRDTFDQVMTDAKVDLSAFENNDLTRCKMPFATFCDLDGYQWIKFQGAHEARHIQQVEAIKASPGYPA